MQLSSIIGRNGNQYDLLGGQFSKSYKKIQIPYAVSHIFYFSREVHMFAYIHKGKEEFSLQLCFYNLI
jgi:hypothetical protein